jgi:hypothetical protein
VERARKAVGFFAFCVLALLVAQPLSPAVLPIRYVNHADATCQGQAPASPCYSTIQAAIGAIQAGGTIRIQAGTYDEALHLTNKNAAPTATEADRIIIEADPAAPLGSVILSNSNAVSCSAGDAIRFKTSQFITLRGLTITGAAGRAIFLAGGLQKNTAIRIERNRIFGNGGSACVGGIVVKEDNATTVIVNNLIYGNRRHGIMFSAGAGGPHRVVSNTIHGNGANGVVIGQGRKVVLVNNLITGNGTQVNGFGIKRTAPPENLTPEQAKLLNNLICGNSPGELKGPLLDNADAGNLTPTGTEGQGVSASAGCNVMGSVFLTSREWIAYPIPGMTTSAWP